MSFLRAQDTVSGQEGKAYATINGSREDLFYAKNIECNFEKNKAEVKTLGHRGTQHKAVGWSGTGSMTIYYLTSLFRKLALEYAKRGVDTYFTLTVVNEDAGSSVGKQTMVFYNCNIDSTVLARLDVDSDALEEDIEFTYDDFDILDEFGRPIVQ